LRAKRMTTLAIAVFAEALNCAGFSVALVASLVRWFLPLTLLCAVQSAIAASLPIPFATDPLAADEQSDRTARLGDAINATLSASQAKAAPVVPKAFSVGINAPLYYDSCFRSCLSGR
jgi:hypothetical protein